MPDLERLSYYSYLGNSQLIESRWDKRFGDRVNELVVIGQDIAPEVLQNELKACLCNENEIRQMEQNVAFHDPFPIL